jgi:hypothetical protein
MFVEDIGIVTILFKIGENGFALLSGQRATSAI